MKTTTTIHHFDASDRLILITYEGSEIVGINYMQGSEIESNLPINQLLTAYVLKRLNYDTTRSEQLEQIDQLIWQYVEYEIISREIKKTIEKNYFPGNVSPSQCLKLKEYTSKLAGLVTEIVINNE